MSKSTIVLFHAQRSFIFPVILILVICAGSCGRGPDTESGISSRDRISINTDWRFYRYDSMANADTLIYDVRPDVFDRRDDRDADARPTEAVGVEETRIVLKPWILPSGNDCIKDPEQRYQRPEGSPGSEFPFVKGGSASCAEARSLCGRNHPAVRRQPGRQG